MGVIRTDESRRAENEIEELRRSCSGVVLKVTTEDKNNHRRNEHAVDDKLVCITSGVSFLGIAIFKQLLTREDIVRLRETESSTSNNLIGVVVAKFNQRQSLIEAFDGCCAAFIDPSGLSENSIGPIAHFVNPTVGQKLCLFIALEQKSMAEIEARAAENVAEACAATPSVRNYVVTSSLLTCIWRDSSNGNLSPVVDHNSWSDESFCSSKKLWYALGKLKAERVSWRIAEEKGLKLTTICPGLITGPHYFCTNPSSTIAYLKGGQDMYAQGLLATVDVNKLADAHVKVYEEMNKSGGGRDVCFDNVVGSPDEVQRLVQEMGVHINTSAHDPTFRFELSNRKLDRLMSQTHRCMDVS